MSTVNTGWLKDNNGEKFAPKTLSSQVMTKDGISIDTLLNELSIDGGVSSWNDLEDKPFYEECSELSNTITWDGDTTGKEFVDMSGDGSMIMYKVSNDFIKHIRS